jgi:hypothetical protein
VLALLLDARREPQHGRVVVGADRLDGDDLGATQRERPRLVDDQRVDRRELLERLARSSRARRPVRHARGHHDRHRRREPERARARDDEHRRRPTTRACASRGAGRRAPTR